VQLELYHGRQSAALGAVLTQLPANHHDIILAAILECAKSKSISVVTECRNCQLEAVIVKIASNETTPKPNLSSPKPAASLRQGVWQIKSRKLEGACVRACRIRSTACLAE
jgi:hypothetical protein